MLIEIPAGAFVKKAVTDRESAVKVACPTCGVEAGIPCVDSDGIAVRKALHVDRHTLAISEGARARYIGGARVFYADEMKTDRAA